MRRGEGAPGGPGAAIYSPWTLPFYELLVFRIACPFAWKCSEARLVAHYEEHLSESHLDVGVATGGLLQRCRFPVEAPRVALLDVNPHCLASAGRRLARYQPELFTRDILGPPDPPEHLFESVGMNFLLHCLEGPMAHKARALDHAGAMLRPGGRIFGATILGGEGAPGWLARAMLRHYNAKGVFDNLDDTVDGLRMELGRRFEEVKIEVVGLVALFSARA